MQSPGVPVNLLVSYSPNAKQTLSPADNPLLEQYGAAVVECSWVRVKEVPWSKIGGKCDRLCESSWVFLSSSSAVY